MELGEGTWSRVSLTHTPPFDALNSPCSVKGRGEMQNFSPTQAGDSLEAFHACEEPNWVDFFPPTHHLAPSGDPVDGGVHSTAASANTASANTASTISGNQTPWSWGNTAPGTRTCFSKEQERGAAGGKSASSSQYSCGTLGGRGRRNSTSEGAGIESPERSMPSWSSPRANESVLEAKQKSYPLEPGVQLYRSGDVLDLSTQRSRLPVLRLRGRSSNLAKRWETFLVEAEQYFESEIQLRKRLSLIRHAHQDVSNEVAFVALALERGRGAEAAAALHQPRAKDEATIVSLLLNVGALIKQVKDDIESRRK
ncbi:unnamed protein product, partial [Discosporangium mesarthrocarpum]